ncbi:MAG TPA: XdhC family protein, partial [Solirubrobacteraceae bacterium]|nr:XdhC family protein [Solirubrobacteraceae bacterium]
LLRAALEGGVPYVGLVASRPRGSGVIAELRADGVAGELLEALDVPAGIDIGARTPAEVAVSILAKLIAARRQSGWSAPNAGGVATAVDPICGMAVATNGSTVSLEIDGERYFFCCEGCRSQFEARRHAGAGA